MSKYFHEGLTEKSNTLKAVIACLTTHVSKIDMFLAKIQSVGKKHSLFPLPPPAQPFSPDITVILGRQNWFQQTFRSVQ